MSIQWGQIRPDPRLSFHLFRTFTRVPGQARAACKRNLDAATVVESRPGNAKTCELCFRAFMFAAERAEEDATMGVTVSE